MTGTRPNPRSNEALDRIGALYAIERGSPAVPDAPAADEILVALGASTGGRPHHRIGDRYQDLKDLGHDVANPAAV